jgi:hypothetical protein
VRDGLYLAGYTIEHGRVPALTGATTEFESPVTENGHALFKLKRGQLLPGLSGSPLLDLHSGLVAAVTESSRGRQADLGGFAVPVTELAAFPGLLAASRAFHDGDGRWQAAAEAERVRAAQRKGERGRLPLRPPVVPLVPDADLSPATVLRPRHAVVGYVGRQELLGELGSWCEREPDGGPPVGLWLVTGGGGLGKTRLAVEACREAEARGWTAGLLRPDVSEAGLAALAEWPGRLLIAVDYAESNPGLAGRLTGELAARPGRAAVRVMLLVRRRASRAELLELLNPQQDEELDGLLRQAPVSRLEDAASEVDRLQLYRQAAEDLAPFLGSVPAGERAPRLRAAHFARPLYVLAAACLAAAPAGADVDALGEAGLLRALIDRHEAGHWERADQQRGLGLDPADRRAAVAVATLLGGEGEQEALAVARLIPHLGTEPESRLIAIARWLAALYPPPADGGPLAIGPLEPDRLGEVLAGDLLREHPGLLAAAIDAASGRQLTRALTVTTRIARDDAAVSAQLRDALDDRLPDLIQRGLTARDDGELLSVVTTAMTASRPARGAADAADGFPNVLPVWLRPLAVTVTALAVDGLRAQASDDPDTIPTLAGSLDSLANRLSGVGRRQEALETATEAVTIRRQLAQASPDAHLPDLAMSLNNLAAFLRGVGLRQEALEPATEAVTIRRQLAQASPDAYLPGLATSLNNLAAFLSEVGRQQEALDPATEAVTHYRQLAQASPEGYLPYLAGSLNNLANHLSGAGRRQEALDPATEAVTHYRQLAQASPGAHLPDLAMSLNTLANHLSEVGRRQEALEPATEAVTHYRQLAQASPDAYLPDLAGSLNNLANRLSGVGLRQEALQPATEAVTIGRQLAQASPDAYLPDLAMSLSNLANRLSGVGLRQEALDPATEAVTHYRQLAQASPDAYLPDLAMSLTTLANRLSGVGLRQEALETATEAVTIRRQLAQANPDAYLPDLAMSLNNLAGHLSEVGLRQEALEPATEAVTIRRQLTQANPDAYLPNLATSLSNLAGHLSGAGRRQEALETATEAVTIRRQLAQANPDAYLPGLATSLNNLANRLSEAGRRQEALDPATEAVTHYRQLTQANPDAYLPGLATSLNNLAAFLSEAGHGDQAEQLFAGVLSDFSASTSGTGYTLLARGQWRAGQGRPADAIADLTAAASAFDHDRLARGQGRQALRALRESDPASFDAAWQPASGPLPAWLEHLTDSPHLTDTIITWIQTPDWDTSRGYLDDNTASLLTDEAEAAIEHLIDINPAAGQLDDHLQLLRHARAHGTAAAYAAHHEQLQASHLAQLLAQWLATPTWQASRAYAATHGDDLLHPATRVLLHALSDQDPADTVLRLHRGLLGYAAAAGFDAAYDLLPDTARQHALPTDPATPATARLAIAMMHSGQASDDPEAHYQLTVHALLAIPDHVGPGDPQAAGLAAQAAAALADCAANAAPWEQRDYARRLTQLATSHPPLAPLIAALQPILTSPPGDRPGGQPH